MGSNISKLKLPYPLRKKHKSRKQKKTKKKHQGHEKDKDKDQRSKDENITIKNSKVDNLHIGDKSTIYNITYNLSNDNCAVQTDDSQGRANQDQMLPQPTHNEEQNPPAESLSQNKGFQQTNEQPQDQYETEIEQDIPEDINHDENNMLPYLEKGPKIDFQLDDADDKPGKVDEILAVQVKECRSIPINKQPDKEKLANNQSSLCGDNTYNISELKSLHVGDKHYNSSQDTYIHNHYYPAPSTKNSLQAPAEESISNPINKQPVILQEESAATENFDKQYSTSCPGYNDDVPYQTKISDCTTEGKYCDAKCNKSRQRLQDCHDHPLKRSRSKESLDNDETWTAINKKTKLDLQGQTKPATGQQKPTYYKKPRAATSPTENIPMTHIKYTKQSRTYSDP